jgi:proprotein convertase subtilisin/kexin type 5
MEASMSLDACAGTVNEVRYLEHVQCKISLRYLPRGNLRILLTSPMGTTSTLLFERPRDVTNANFDEWPFLSVHFWGEKADGTWTLQIINAGERRVAHPGMNLRRASRCVHSPAFPAFMGDKTIVNSCSL